VAEPAPKVTCETCGGSVTPGYRCRFCKTDCHAEPARSLPYVRGSATSEDAAQSMRIPAVALRERVYDLISKHPQGLTCDEVEVMTGRSHQSVSARIRELKQADRIAQAGRRSTRSGRNADIHVVPSKPFTLEGD